MRITIARILMAGLAALTAGSLSHGSGNNHWTTIGLSAGGALAFLLVPAIFDYMDGKVTEDEAREGRQAQP